MLPWSYLRGFSNYLCEICIFVNAKDMEFLKLWGLRLKNLLCLDNSNLWAVLRSEYLLRHTGQKFKICSHSKVSKNSKTWWDYIPKLHSKTINILIFYPQNVRLTLKVKNTLNIESLQDSLKASSVLQLWKAIKIEIFT